MYVRAYIDGHNRYVAASFSGPRIVVADYDRRLVVNSIPLPEGVYNAFDMTPDARVLVTGYWSTRGVDVWNVATGELLYRLSLDRVSRVRVDPTGECIVVTSERGGRAIHWHSGRLQPIVRCGSADGAAIRQSGNMMLIPITRKGTVLQMRWSTFEFVALRFAIDARIWTLRWSPDDTLLVMLSSNGVLSCFRSIAEPPLWRVTLEQRDVTSLCNFCGDSSLLALYATEARRLLVFDPQSGHVIRHVNECVDPGSVFSGTMIMTSMGKVVDLSTGTVSDGCSNWRWWRGAGA